MRQQFQQWAATFPKAPGHKDGTYAGAKEAQFVRREVADAVRAAVPTRLTVRGSAGDRDWTHTPWVSLLEPTMAVEDGVYVVYLLSHGCERLYLAVAQGVTHLYKKLGKSGAAAELVRRAELLRPLAIPIASRLSHANMNLATRSWRGQLYEAGAIMALEYRTDDIPSESNLAADLQEAIAICSLILPAASWGDTTDVLEQARRERGKCNFEESKKYGYHRHIERNRKIPKAVKEILGTQCGGCLEELSGRYGPRGTLIMEVHHLKPLSALREGEKASYDDVSAFAVLCPNCHRVIHRMPDVADVAGLRNLIAIRHRVDGA